MNNDALNPRPTIGVLAGWQFYEGNVNGFLDLVLRGVHLAAREQNCNLLFACGVGHAIGPVRLCPAWPEVSSETDFVPVGPWNTDGLIVINPLLSNNRVRYIQQVRKEGHPVVFVGPGEGKAVVPDNESGIRQAVAHFAQHGHRQVAFIAGRKDEVDQDSIKRLQAYRAAVREYGLETNPAMIAYGSHNFSDGRQAMKQLLESGMSFRAVLASNDYSAFGAISALREANLRIPQDIAIIGFDDVPEAVGQEPPLTTVHYPSINAGKKALTLLIKAINGHATGDEIVPVPVHLIVRESCGCQSGNPILAVPPIQGNACKVAKSQLTYAIVGAVRAESNGLNSDEIEAFCGKLVEAFVHSLQESKPAVFHAAFSEILHQMEESEDDPTMWHSAISLLERSAPELLETWNDSIAGQAVAMLNQARVAISISLRKQKVQYISNRGNIADQIGLLTSHLFTAVDDNQIFEMLREFLPKVGIARADIGFYEAQGDDSVAWSRLYPVFNANRAPIRFASRRFPPEGLYSQERPFSLVLFPLIHQDKVDDGFVVFDSLDLGACVTIVRQLTAAFRSVRLYREAVESRKLAEEGRKLAEEANYIKSRFLSTVSHELRTPLNLIVGLSNLVLQEEETPESPALPPSHRRDLEQIHTNAEHLGRLIRDVLDLATSQAGQLRLELESLDLLETLRAAIEAGEELARQKGLEWKISVPAGPLMVMGDRTRLRQVLLNLISNAVKFTEHGRVEVQIEGQEGGVLVSVRDTGLGIAAGEQEIIFDEFRQSERTTARGYGGMGLGLAISRRLVELHGGRIGVQSSGQDGAGSTFYFTLPVIQQPQEDEISSLDKGRFVALLVEERSKEGEPLESHLASQGFQVRTFQVDEFSWMTQLLTTLPGAVILDASLAPKRGWEIIRALKGNPATQDVPVIFYSLTHDQGSILEIDYLTKPVGPSDLVHALARQGLDAGADNRDKTILIADDEPGILEMNARIVQAQLPACRVLQARNGREALEVIHQQRPDLVLLDLMMPELDGFGVLKAMREGENTRDIPVIVLTGQALTEEDMARLNQGVAAVLQKEIFNAQETLAHIKAALARVHQLGSEMQNIIRKAMAYIQDHYSESFSRKEIARYVGVSERYLTRCFHQELGITPVEYLNRYRMKRARAMLESGENVTDTALETGFSSVSYFTKFFQKEVGMLPSAYRQLHLKK